MNNENLETKTLEAITKNNFENFKNKLNDKAKNIVYKSVFYLTGAVLGGLPLNVKQKIKPKIKDSKIIDTAVKKTLETKKYNFMYETNKFFKV